MEPSLFSLLAAGVLQCCSGSCALLWAGRPARAVQLLRQALPLQVRPVRHSIRSRHQPGRSCPARPAHAQHGAAQARPPRPPACQAAVAHNSCKPTASPLLIGCFNKQISGCLVAYMVCDIDDPRVMSRTNSEQNMSGVEDSVLTKSIDSSDISSPSSSESLTARSRDWGRRRDIRHQSHTSMIACRRDTGKVLFS